MDLTRIDLHSGDPHQVVVAVSGEIDLANHDKLLDTIETAVKKAEVDGANRVVVDLSQATFLDSGGVRVLVEGRRAADVVGVHYLVTGISGLVRTVLEVTGVLSFLTEDPIY